MAGPNFYIIGGAIMLGVSVLFGAWAVRHDRKAGLGAKAANDQPELPFAESKPKQRAHA